MNTILKSLGSGVLYTALARYSGVIISIVIGAILARLLTPEEFGIVALVSVFTTFFNLLSNFGLGPAVVQSQKLNNEDIKSIFSFSIILGFTLSGIFFLAAPLIANFYDKPELIVVSRYLSIAVLFNSWLIIPKALFQKALKFKALGIINVFIQFVCGIIAIIMAYSGYSYYALVTQSILVGVLSLIIFYSLKPIHITWHIKFNSIKKILRFSVFQFSFNFINYFSRNLDNILIGKFLGTAPLGFYEKSYRLMTLPVQNLTHIITPVLMPVLSKHQNDKDVIFNTYLKVVKLLATIGFPLSIFLFYAAPEIITIIFGTQWEQSVPVFKILALSVGIQMILSSSGSIFQAVNRTDLLFYSGSLSALFMVGGICYGIFIGENLEAVGYGLIVAFVINLFQGFYMLIKLALNASFLEFLKIFKFPLITSFAILLALWFFSKNNIQNIFLLLGMKVLIASIIFLFLNLSNTDNRNILLRSIKNIKKDTKKKS